ncbi:hypothetical protein MLOOGBEN_14605 [Bacillus sp. EB106-08-02-XG196]|uniref:hypothetical protein n=1 Tax=Bacillus sp. EB106-08-02-XG196 TaxID=2737049 RepID=UPI00185C3AB4|nr:hypothetical protein [Bacillus sp. EB106-08-02-XG196]NWQ41926.1 hypothetical protein [Bacillus sp. EB106-08-02-XG196]
MTRRILFWSRRTGRKKTNEQNENCDLITFGHTITYTLYVLDCYYLLKDCLIHPSSCYQHFLNLSFIILLAFSLYQLFDTFQRFLGSTNPALPTFAAILINRLINSNATNQTFD